MAADLNWKEFEPSTFDIAKREDRPVLLVVTKHWCPHSRALLQQTFRSAEVVRLIAESFVPVKVDAARRPDVNERYGTGSWPTIAYLTPDGELISQDGFLDPTGLAERLRRITEYYHAHRDEIADGLKSLWARREEGELIRNEAHGRLNHEIVEDVVHAMYDKFDHRWGGWGESSKFPHPEAIDFALVMVAKRDDQRMREVVTLTLDKMAEGAVHDSIDGGFFRYSSTPDWRSPHYEKILEANAMRLRCYLEAYQVFENPAYLKVAKGIVHWMRAFMLDPDTGAFFGAQDAEADYYVLDAEARKERRPPNVDPTIYTNWNSLTVSALLKASVVLDDSELRDTAMRTLGFLIENLYDQRDGVFHYWDGTYHLPGMLSDQAYMIRALIDAAQHTGDNDLLLVAERIAELAIERQKAPGGGFFDILHDSAQHGSMRRRNRSILENSVMAESLLRLAYLSRRPEFHDEAVETLAAFTGDYKEYGYYVAGYGRAVDLIFYQPLEITILGHRDTEAADMLRRAALAPYVPSRVVQMLDPRHDPVLLERSGFVADETPIAHCQLGGETVATARSANELIAAITKIEESRG